MSDRIHINQPNKNQEQKRHGQDHGNSLALKSFASPDSENQTFTGNRPGTIAQREFQEELDKSPQVQEIAQLQSMINNSPRQVTQRKELTSIFDGTNPTLQRKTGEEEEKTVQAPKSTTGLPDNLKAGIENLSGISMNDVKVHSNSSKPAELNALAYAQGNDIHLGPGQEKHLPHEAWHVVQQRQGRVKPTMQMKGVAVNDEDGLEKEADVMGEKALVTLNVQDSKTIPNQVYSSAIVQKIDDEETQNAKDYKSYTGKTFKISNSDARVRNAKFEEIVYKKEDVIPEGKKEGDKVIIPKDKDVIITEVKEQNGKLYIFVEDYGWTSATNVEGGFINETLGVAKASWESQDPKHKTVGSSAALIREFKGFNFNERKPKVVIPKSTWIKILEESEDGKFIKCASDSGVEFGWTSKNNLDLSKSDPTHPDAKQVKDPDARLRDKAPNYESTGKNIAQGSYVIVKEESQNTDPLGLYVKVASVKKEDGVNVEDAVVGWTAASNLAGGWADFKSSNAEWEGGAYIGQTDLVQVIGTGQDLAYVGSAGADKYIEMAAAASIDGATIGLNSGFRSYSEQKYLHDNQHKPGFNPANRPGTSNHQKGKALDLNNRVDSKVNSWLEIHAWEYGFIKVYEQAKEAHHWEYRPEKIKQPEIIEKNNVKYRRTFWGTWATAYTDTKIEE